MLLKKKKLIDLQSMYKTKIKLKTTMPKKNHTPWPKTTLQILLMKNSVKFILDFNQVKNLEIMLELSKKT